MHAHLHTISFAAVAKSCAWMASILLLAGGCGSAVADGADGVATTNSTTQDSASAAVSAAPFAGTYQVTVDGEQSALTIVQSGAALSGTLDNLRLRGSASNDTAQVELLVPETGAVGATAQLQRSGQQLIVIVTLPHPQTGEMVQLPPLAFVPVGRAAQPAAQSAPQPAAQQVTQQTSAQRDARLVGRWLYTWTAASNGFTAAVDTWFILKPDGTYEYGDGRAAAGGATSSIITDRGPVETGRWRTENKVLYLMQDGDGSEWNAVARYMIADANMMLIYSNGGKKVWSRQ